VRELFTQEEPATAARAAPALALAAQPPGQARPPSWRYCKELYRVAADLLAAGPLAILLDDAQDCELPTLRWIDFLLRRAAALPLLDR
jgi:hypothetical protein